MVMSVKALFPDILRLSTSAYEYGGTKFITWQ